MSEDAEDIIYEFKYIKYWAEGYGRAGTDDQRTVRDFYRN